MLIAEGESDTAGGGRRIGWSPVPTVERGTEATDRGGDPRAGGLDANGGPALQPQRQPGV